VSEYRKRYIAELANRTGKHEMGVELSLRVAMGREILPPPKFAPIYGALIDDVFSAFEYELNGWLIDVGEVFEKRLEELHDRGKEGQTGDDDGGD